MTDNTMAKMKRTKGQRMIYKNYTENQKFSNRYPITR